MARLIIKGSHRESATRFLPYDTDGLLYWGMLGKDVLRTQTNQVDGSAVAVKGAPVYAADWCTFEHQVSYLNLGQTQQPNHTFIAVFKAPYTPTPTALISNYNSPTASGTPASARGTALALSASTGITDRLLINMDCSVNAAGVDTIAPATLGGYLVDTWACIAGTVDSTSRIRNIYNLTAGTSATHTSPHPTNLGTGSFRVGSPIVGGTAKPTIAMIASYNKAKTKAEIDALHLKLRTYYARLGINI